MHPAAEGSFCNVGVMCRAPGGCNNIAADRMTDAARDDL